MQLVGVRGSGRMRRVLHLLRQVPRAVQGVGGRPAEERLLAVKEDELQGEVRAGGLCRTAKRRSAVCSQLGQGVKTQKWVEERVLIGFKAVFLL